MIETLMGGLLGGLFRLTPEVLRALDRRSDRWHELAMQDKAIEYERLRGPGRMPDTGVGADTAWNASTVEALRDAVSSHTQPDGMRWADALSSSVRPVVTYGFMALYCAAKTAAFVGATTGGADWSDAVQQAWTEADQALWAGVLNFWFLGRVLDKARR